MITGANTGMGYETALELARRGCRVYVACRAKVEGEADPTDTVKEIRRLSGNYDVHFRKLDMSLLGAVQEFAEMFQKEEDKLDILVNNAGVCAPSLVCTCMYGNVYFFYLCLTPGPTTVVLSVLFNSFPYSTGIQVGCSVMHNLCPFMTLHCRYHRQR